MNLTFKEKSLLIQIIALALVFGGYFLKVLPISTNASSAEMMTQLIFIIIALVTLVIVGHIFTAINHKPEKLDERDKVIELKASRVKAFILSSGTIIAILCSLKADGNFWIVHTLLIFLVISDATEKALQLFYYRRGL